MAFAKASSLAHSRCFFFPFRSSFLARTPVNSGVLQASFRTNKKEGLLPSFLFGAERFASPAPPSVARGADNRAKPSLCLHKRGERRLLRGGSLPNERWAQPQGRIAHLHRTEQSEKFKSLLLCQQKTHFCLLDKSAFFSYLRHILREITAKS